TGDSGDGDEVRLAALQGPPIGRLQELELALPADERGPETGDATRPRQCERPDELPAGDAVGFPLRSHDGRFCELERTLGGGGRALADKYLARRRGLLEPRRDVDSVAGHERAALARTTHDDLAAVHADMQREGRAEQPVAAAADGERGVQC